MFQKSGRWFLSLRLTFITASPSASSLEEVGRGGGKIGLGVPGGWVTEISVRQEHVMTKRFDV